MGNCKSNHLYYIDKSNSALEKKLRLFESNVLTNDDPNVQLERSFSSIYSQICFDSTLFQGKNKENLLKFFMENFTEKMSNFVLKSSYFKFSESEEYDMKKIKILLFLLSFNSNEIIKDTENPDKVIFFFNYFRVHFCTH